MNIVKIGLLLLTGLGFGFGVDTLTGLDESQDDFDNTYGEIYYGHCQSEDFSLDHMLENLSEEEQVLVQEKVEELLQDYNITMEELYQDVELRHDFMIELMDFLDDNDIDYHYHDDNDWHHGMGMHRR